MKKQLATMLSVLCLFALPALTQEFRSTISGHVTDASGAAVPNAKVNAVNNDTNETTTATTDNAGAYSIPFLRPGSYKVTATAAGFKQYGRQTHIGSRESLGCRHPSGSGRCE